MNPVRFTLEASRTAAVDLLRRPIGSVLSITAMAIAIALFGGFLVMMQGVAGAIGLWTGQSVAEVYLADDAEEREITVLTRTLEARDAVRRVERISREASLREFRAQFPEFDDVETLLGENPFPASLRLYLDDAGPGEIGEIELSVRGSRIVSGFRYDREWISTLARVGQAIGWLFFGGSFVLLLSALVTIGSVVRLALDDKREEIRLMRLIGAPASFVLGPILLAGAALGGIGGTLAVIGVETGRALVIKAAAAGPLAGWTTLFLGGELGAIQAVFLVALALSTGTVAAGLAAGREAVR